MGAAKAVATPVEHTWSRSTRPTVCALHSRYTHAQNSDDAVLSTGETAHIHMACIQTAKVSLSDYETCCDVMCMGRLAHTHIACQHTGQISMC